MPNGPAFIRITEQLEEKKEILKSAAVCSSLQLMESLNEKRGIHCQLLLRTQAYQIKCR